MNRLHLGITILFLLALSLSAGYKLFFVEPKTARIEFVGVSLTVELATTPSAQQEGLSNRTSMPSNRGMLFIFGQAAQWSFWMHDMEFPLDIIWFNGNRQAVFIEQDLPPCTPTLCQVFTPTTNALYVLEVNAGFVQSNGVILGDVFSFI